MVRATGDEVLDGAAAECMPRLLKVWRPSSRGTSKLLRSSLLCSH